MYTDGPIFFGQWGDSLTAHHYNSVAKRSGGKVEAVWANKGKDDCVNGTCVLDLERGVVDRIWDDPWQTDTCIGTWHYNKEATYKTPKIVIDMLVDIVSRNGNLLLNFPLPSSGMLDPQELAILDGDHPVDVPEWRSDLRYAPVEDLWRRAGGDRCRGGSARSLRSPPGRSLQ